MPNKEKVKRLLSIFIRHTNFQPDNTKTTNDLSAYIDYAVKVGLIDKKEVERIT